MPASKRLPPPPLTCLITAGESNPSNFNEKKSELLDLLRIAIETGISLFQIREKILPARMLFDLASEAGRMTHGTNTRLLINDRADIALAAEIDGIHLPTNSLRADVIRRSFPASFIIGVSAHSLGEVSSAAAQGADFAMFGPVYATPDKGQPTGLAELSRVCKLAGNFPVIGLGGINETNYPSVMESGASGFAAIRYLNNAENLRKLSYDLTDE